MKTTVILDELAVSDVRSDTISQQYAALRRDEAIRLIGDEKAVWTGRPYPTPDCDPVSVFVRDGLSFHHCRTYGTIFASPVPSQATLDALATECPSFQLKQDYYANQSSKSRRDSIHGPILRWASEIVDEHLLTEPATAFVGVDETGISNSLIDELASSCFALTKRLPIHGSDARFTDIDLNHPPSGRFDLVFDIGSLERVANPLDRIALWRQIAKPGGFVAFTTSTASGLEYRLLGPDAPSFISLDRLTLYSIPALRAVMEANGFEVVELSTPGRVDVETIGAALADSENDNQLDFWRHALSHGDEYFRADLQTFLQRHRLSSFARVLVRKKGDPTAG